MATTYVFGAGGSIHAGYPLSARMGEGLLEFMLNYPVDRYQDSANVLIELFGKSPNIEDMITALEERIEALKDATNLNDKATRSVLAHAHAHVGEMLREWFRVIHNSPAQEKEVPEELNNAKVPKAHSTTVTYRRYLKKWILPRWESLLLQDFRSVAVEDWLHGLSLANGTKAKIRNIMSAVFRHAIRYGFLPRHDESNPMKYVRQTAESNVVFTILLEEQVWGIVGNLRQPAHTMAFLDAFTGLRISELLALKWADIDFDKLEINVSRAIVYGVVGKCKSKASKKPLPLDPAMAAALCGWRKLTPFNAADDWIFASPKTDGRMPLTPDNLRRRHLQPAAKQAGVEGKVGWHTFRRTLASLFIANGVDVKATQELLRHANSKIVLDLYAQATTSNKRAAQSKVIEMVLPKPPQVVAAMR